MNKAPCQSTDGSARGIDESFITPNCPCTGDALHVHRDRHGSRPRGSQPRQFDVLIGRLFELLKQGGIDEEALILLHADNGAETRHVLRMREDHGHDPVGGWRGMKRDGWEGGHRVPFIARWPGKIPAGRVTAQMMNTTDIFATLASANGFTLPDDAALNSFDLLPVLLGKQADDRPGRPHLLTQSFQGQFQIRQGQWKYLDHQGSGGNKYEGDRARFALPEREPDAPGQLYDLAKDPGETTNLYFKEEAKRKELQALLKKLKEDGRSAPKGRTPVLGLTEP